MNLLIDEAEIGVSVGPRITVVCCEFGGRSQRVFAALFQNLLNRYRIHDTYNGNVPESLFLEDVAVALEHIPVGFVNFPELVAPEAGKDPARAEDG